MIYLNGLGIFKQTWMGEPSSASGLVFTKLLVSKIRVGLAYHKSGNRFQC
jgi:hypothetical protein